MTNHVRSLSMRHRWLGLAAVLGIPLVLAAAPNARPTTSPVAEAAARHDVEAVKRLIKAKADVNAPQGDGSTALHWAAKYHDVELVKILLKAGAKPNVVTLNGNYTPLHIAARGGVGGAVIEMLKAGADAKAVTLSGATPLHMAASSGDVVSVNALLARGADPNAREREWEQTPLVFAATANRADAIRALIKGGADPQIYTKAQRQAEITAQDRLAVQRRNEFAAELRGDPRPDTAAINAAARAAAAAAAAAGADTTAAGRGGRGQGARGGGGGGAGGGGRPLRGLSPTQIQQAVAVGREVVLQGMRGTDFREEVDTANGDVAGFTALAGGLGGFTPLHIAARDGALQAVSALLDGGANINAPSVHDSTTPLLQAAISGQFDVQMELIKRGADPNLASSQNGVAPLWATVHTAWVTRTRTPQQQAWQYQKTSHLEVIEALLKAGARPDTKIRSQPFYFAYNGCGNPNCGLENVGGSTALWRAAYSLDIEAMRLLIKHGADVKTFKAQAAGGGRGGGGGGGGGRAGAPDSAAAAVAGAPGRGGRFGGAAAAAGLDSATVAQLVGRAGGARGGRGGFGGAGVAGDSTAAIAGGRGGGRGGGGGGRGGAAGGGGDPGALAGRGGGGGGGGGGAGALDPSLVGPGSFLIHCAAGVGYGLGVGAGNSHRHVPDGWIPALKYVIEELNFDPNMRDNRGMTAMHYAAARGDNESIKYLISKGGDPKVVDAQGRTTVDMANGPAARIVPYPETIKLLESYGAKNNHRCQSC